jgi:hypothetical protein
MKRHALILLVALGAAPAVGAQTAIDVRTSFGATNYKQNDLEYAAPEVRVAVRAGSERFAVEPELGFAWGSTTDTSHQFRNLGVNAIARARGRVSPFFGGGIGVYSERHESAVNGQAGTQTFGPRVGTQIVFGVDVRSTSRVGVFGEGRFEARSFGDSGGGSAFQGFAGVAISLRDAPWRASRSAQSIAELRRRYVDGPVLIVPRAGSGTLNTTGSTVIPGAGTVFRAMANNGAWGFFDAQKGALISADDQTISLPGPVVFEGRTLKGDGWTATLGPGWNAQPGSRPGSFRIVRQ